MRNSTPALFPYKPRSQEREGSQFPDQSEVRTAKGWAMHPNGLLFARSEESEGSVRVCAYVAI